MIDYVELIERKVSRKVMNRKKERKPGKDKEIKTGVRRVFIACASLRRYIRVLLQPQSAGISHTKCGH